MDWFHGMDCFFFQKHLFYMIQITIYPVGDVGAMAPICPRSDALGLNPRVLLVTISALLPIFTFFFFSVNSVRFPTVTMSARAKRTSINCFKTNLDLFFLFLFAKLKTSVSKDTSSISDPLSLWRSFTPSMNLTPTAVASAEERKPTRELTNPKAFWMDWRFWF